MKVTPGHKWCKQCKRERPLESFMAMPAPWKVNICVSCQTSNMAAYWKNHGEMRPERDPLSKVRE